MPVLILLQFINEYADELLCALFRVQHHHLLQGRGSHPLNLHLFTPHILYKYIPTCEKCRYPISIWKFCYQKIVVVINHENFIILGLQQIKFIL